jgi:hypothetical protein
MLNTGLPNKLAGNLAREGARAVTTEVNNSELKCKYPTDDDSLFKSDNQRQSDNLMNIVAVIYGVALTAAFISRPHVIIDPVSRRYAVANLALLAAALLTALSFYGYVLALGGDKPYRVAFSKTSANGRDVFLFFFDLALAGLYVRLLYVAANVTIGPKTKPELASFVFALLPVWVGLMGVRSFRYGFDGRYSIRHNIMVPLVALILTFGIYALVVTTNISDFLIELLLLLFIAFYGIVNHSLAYKAWERRNASQ